MAAADARSSCIPPTGELYHSDWQWILLPAATYPMGLGFPVGGFWSGIKAIIDASPSYLSMNQLLRVASSS